MRQSEIEWDFVNSYKSDDGADVDVRNENKLLNAVVIVDDATATFCFPNRCECMDDEYIFKNRSEKLNF